MLQKTPIGPGSDGYVFVSYSHRDARRVKKEIEYLEQAGITVWYDHAIRPGHRWRVELAHAIEGCRAFVFFSSESAVQSSNCEQELTYAAEHQRPLLQVQLDEIELPTEFRFTLAAQQAIYAWELPKESYREQLATALLGHLGNEAPTVAAPVSVHRPRVSRVRRILPGIAVVGALLAGLAVWNPLQTWQTSRPGTSLDTPFAASDRSIAVMRFISIGGNRAIADGLCEQLLHLLMSLQEISVPSRTSTWQATEESLDPQDVAHRLGVRYVLEGSVQQDEDRLRVTAQLIDGFSGNSVWSESYDKDLGAVSFFEIQDDIASQLVQQLDVTLSGESIAQIAARPTSDDIALRSYLEGRNYRRGPTTDDNIEAAKAAFGDALERDPNFIEAHAALCEAHLAAYMVVREDETFRAAKDSCLNAQRADEGQTMVQVALGTLYRFEGRFDYAEVAIDRARRQQPRNVAVMEEQGRLLRAMGREADAETAFEEAIRTEPGNWSVYKSLGNFYLRVARYSEAIGLYRQALRLDQDNEVVKNNLASALHMDGEFDRAGALWNEITERSPSFLAYVNLANARFYDHKFEDAVNWYNKALEVSGSDYRAYGGRAASLEYARGLSAALADYRKASELALVASERNRSDTATLSRLSFYQAKLGKADLARATLLRLDALPTLEPDTQFIVALTLITLGEDDAAQATLARAIAAGYSMALVKADPLAAGVYERLSTERA